MFIVIHHKNVIKIQFLILYFYSWYSKSNFKNLYFLKLVFYFFFHFWANFIDITHIQDISASSFKATGDDRIHLNESESYSNTLPKFKR